MDTNAITQMITMLLAIIAGFYAWLQNNQKKEVVAFYAEPASPVSDAVVSTLPVRSWTMTESTRRWITFGESDSDKIEILKQVDASEALGLRSYTIHYSKGFYLIEYGLIKSSGREK